jgi:hypothetical protein
MKSVLPALLILAALAAAPTGAAAQTPPQAARHSPAACVQPPPPAFPTPAAAATLQPQDMQQHRLTRDSYFAAADANLACLDADIEARVRTLFATGAAMDAGARAQGLAHEEASRERAAVYEQFLRMCLAYEDAKGPIASGCR